MAKVYVVFHADIEDDRYIRAVCATRERAEAIANSPEVCSLSHEHASIGGYRTRPENCAGSYDHMTRGGRDKSLCCGVDEWEVDDQAATV